MHIGGACSKLVVRSADAVGGRAGVSPVMLAPAPGSTTFARRAGGVGGVAGVGGAGVVGVVGAEDGDAAGHDDDRPDDQAERAGLPLALDLLGGGPLLLEAHAAGPRPGAVASRSAWRRTVVGALCGLRVGQPGADGTTAPVAHIIQQRPPGRGGSGGDGGIGPRAVTRSEGSETMAEGDAGAARATEHRRTQLLDRGRASGCGPCGGSAGCPSTTSSGSPAAAGAPRRSAPTSGASAT